MVYGSLYDLPEGIDHPLALWRLTGVPVSQPASMKSYGFSPLEGFSWIGAAPSGSSHQIEYSNDMNQWFELATVVSDQGTVQFSDPDAAHSDRRFYRVIPK
jgi:hypothetical protein